tara:strand:- start:485 stop:682 length:198 start_codon:yes stop_codon:yes gene_type:complete
MHLFEVRSDCKDCCGYGYIEPQSGVADFSHYDCPVCTGTGLIRHYEEFDNHDDAPTGALIHHFLP